MIIITRSRWSVYQHSMTMAMGKITELKRLKITALLPEKTKAKLENEKSKENKLLIQVAQINLWKKWRGKIHTKKQDYQHGEG